MDIYLSSLLQILSFSLLFFNSLSLYNRNFFKHFIFYLLFFVLIISLIMVIHKYYSTSILNLQSCYFSRAHMCLFLFLITASIWYTGNVFPGLMIMATRRWMLFLYQSISLIFMAYLSCWIFYRLLRVRNLVINSMLNWNHENMIELIAWIWRLLRDRWR